MRQGTFTGLRESRVNSLDEAIETYGLDKPVEKRELRYDHMGESLLSPNHTQTVNPDNGEPYGVVGKDYETLTYRESWDFAEELMANGATAIRGGAPNRGEVGYLILENPGSIKVGRHEILNQYLLRSSHDGSTKIECRSVPYFTANRIAMTIDATRALSFKHTRNVRGRIGRARNVFKRVNEQWNEFTGGVQKMIATNVTDEEARAFIEQITPSASESKRIENIREDIFTLFKLTGQARVIHQCRGTLFGLVQAVGEWSDLHRVTRKTNKRTQEAAMLDTRLVSDAARRKQKAWMLSLWMIKNGKLRGASVGGI